MREYAHELLKKGYTIRNAIVCVDISKYQIYAFLSESYANSSQLLQKALELQKEDIATWERNYKNYSCEQYKKYLEQARKREYVVMTYEQFLARQREYLLNTPLKEISAECYDNALAIL